MDFSGISDEAGKALDTQIRAHKELGWGNVELRNVDGTQFTDLTDEQFDAACAALAAADMKVSSFASGIANWACRITDPMDKSVETLARAIPRMQRLGTTFIRTMSFPNDGLDEGAWRDETVRRMTELGRMAADGGITIVVENCDGWASSSPENYGRFFELVDSPAVKAVYDTGNAASHGHSNTWQWYQAAKPHVAYIHIKAHTGPADSGRGEHVWPDVGASCITETLTDLLADGYEGFVAIEPHLKAIIHEGQQITDEEAAFRTYVQYGRRLAALVAKLKG